MENKNLDIKWPLATNDFNWLDRLKICKFFLTSSNRWTQGGYVKDYERQIAQQTGYIYAVFVSSGSAANQLIAQCVKDTLIKNKEWGKRNKVIVSAVSWQTNASVWVREGFEPIFVDISLKDFSMDVTQVEEILRKESENIACIFPTSVLGFNPDFRAYIDLQKRYKVRVAFDNCENFYSPSSSFTSSISVYVAHQHTNGLEGGFILTNCYEEYKYYVMARAHGLSRNLKSYSGDTFAYEDSPWKLLPIYNELVDQEFNFAVLSSNYRNTDIAAFLGLLNLKKISNDMARRQDIYDCFSSNLDGIRYYLPNYSHANKVFCLPIVCKEYPPGNNRLEHVKYVLDKMGIEYRPFISGNQLRQTCYQKYGNYKDFPNAEYINNFACYIGINRLVSTKMVKELCDKLNKL